jgi:dTDP-L-rhamnose 4-epimerase
VSGRGTPARVLITGGAGFLGAHLARRLLAAGYRVRLLDCLDPQVHPGGRPPRLPAEAELRVGSVLDAAGVDAALEDVTAVVHFAAVVGVGQSMYQIERYTANNLQGTAVLLEALLRRQRRPGSGLSRLLLAGSMSIYGEGRYWCPACRAERAVAGRSREALQRQRWEPPCGDCGGALEPRPTDEAKPPQLGSLYALSKYTQEEMCRLFGRTYGVPTVVLRLFNTYGPGQALSNPYTGVAAVFAAELLAGRAPQVFEDGRQLRDLVSVHDVMAACQLALERDGVADAVMNIAGGEAVSIAALARALAEALHTPLAPAITGRYRLGDARHCLADITEARRRLGYAPRVGLREGMAELGDWLGRQRAAAALAGGLQAHATAELRAFGLVG